MGLLHEGDQLNHCLQAMAAYRTAARLFPGLHLPLVGMGMEYQRMNNLHLAEQLFEQVWQAALPSQHPVVLLAGTTAHCTGRKPASFRNTLAHSAGLWPKFEISQMLAHMHWPADVATPLVELVPAVSMWCCSCRHTR